MTPDKGKGQEPRGDSCPWLIPNTPGLSLQA
jgi:hypothetical protein